MDSDNFNFSKDDEESIIFDTKELISRYPKLFPNKYSVDIAIKKGNLPFFRNGHKRFFDKNSVENWISKNNKPLIVVRSRR